MQDYKTMISGNRCRAGSMQLRKAKTRLSTSLWSDANLISSFIVFLLLEFNFKLLTLDAESSVLHRKQLSGLIDCPGVIQRQVHTSRVVEVFEFFCIGNLGGDVGVLLLKLFQLRSPCRPGAIRNEVIIHFVINDAVNENLSPPAVKQLCDVFPVHDSWGSPPTALWPNRQTCPH